MLAYWTIDEVCLFANDAYKAWFGKSRTQVIGATMRELLGPLYELNLPYIRRAKTGEPQVFERTIPAPDGGLPRESLATYTPDIVDGVVHGFFVHVADVTAMAGEVNPRVVAEDLGDIRPQSHAAKLRPAESVRQAK